MKQDVRCPIDIPYANVNGVDRIFVQSTNTIIIVAYNVIMIITESNKPHQQSGRIILSGLDKRLTQFIQYAIIAIMEYKRCPICGNAYHVRLNRFHKPEPQGKAMACEHGPCETCPLDGK